jgi:hypothetical protein
MFMSLDQDTLNELGRRGIPHMSRFGKDGGMIPPPDPTLLQFHAQITQILHFSGLWGTLISSKPAMEYEAGSSVLEGDFVAGLGWEF